MRAPKTAAPATHISLVEEFHSAVTNLTTMYSARAAAEYSEQNTLQALQHMQTGNGLYVTPEDIPDEAREQLTRTSLDAHLKRVQSEQISASALQQVTSREEVVKNAFIGRRITFLVEDASFQPFESVWLDQRTGKLSSSIIRNRVIKGTVDDLSFDRNLIVLKPTYFSRLFTPRRKYFLVHVINTSTLTPAISVVG